MNTKRTPGPWQLEPIGFGGIHNDIPVYDIRGVDGTRICTVAGDDAKAIVDAVNEIAEQRAVKATNAKS